MKKIILFAICACVLIGPIYSESYQQYLQRQEEERKKFDDKQNQEFNAFVKKQEQEFNEFIKKRELNFKKYWGLVNDESFADTKERIERAEEEEPPAFKAKFSVCFNCADTGADLQVASEDENGTVGWETAKKSCEKRGDGWYLPTDEELGKVYKSKKEMGGFSDAEYWSFSKEWNASENTAFAKVINFKDGRSGSYNPNETKRVRCVRRMPDSQGGNSKKVVVEYDKIPKDERNKKEVQQQKSASQIEDKTPKKDSKEEKVKSDDKPSNKYSSQVKTEPNRPTNVFTPGQFIWPVENYCRRAISSNFGERQKIIKGKPVKGKGFHYGIDIVCQDQNIEGKPVIAAAAGKVVYTGFDKGKNKSYGNYIRIEHPDGRRTIYGHLSEITVKQGDNVMQGQEVGKAGKTGFVTGPHLHFEIRHQDVAQDPLEELPKTNIILKK